MGILLCLHPNNSIQNLAFTGYSRDHSEPNIYSATCESIYSYSNSSVLGGILNTIFIPDISLALYWINKRCSFFLDIYV